MKISYRVSELLSRHNFHGEFSKGNNSVKNVDEVKVLIHCILSDDALYVYIILGTNLQTF